MAVLADFYGAVGEVVRRFEATVGHLGGDSVMAYFNDPMPCDQPEVLELKGFRRPMPAFNLVQAPPACGPEDGRALAVATDRPRS